MFSASLTYAVVVLLCADSNPENKLEPFLEDLRSKEPAVIQDSNEFLQSAENTLRDAAESFRTWEATYAYADGMRFEGPAAKTKLSTDHKQSKDPHLLAVRSDIVRLHSTAGAGYWEVDTGVCSVTFDRNNKLWKLEKRPHGKATRLSPPKYAITESGKFSTTNWILTPEHWLEFQQNHEWGPLREYPAVPFLDAVGKRIVYRREVSEATRLNNFIAPATFFGDGSRYFHDFMRLLQSNPQKIRDQLQIYAVPSSPKTFTILAAAPNAPTLLFTLTKFADGNRLTEYRHYDLNENLICRVQMDYQSPKTTIIPSKVRVVKYSPRGNQPPQPYLVRHLSIRESKFDTSLDPSIFEAEGLGLTYGERCVDELENELLICDKNGEFVPLADFKFDPFYLANRNKQGNGLTYGLIALIVGLSAFFVWRKIRRQ